MDPTTTLAELLAAIDEHNATQDRATQDDCRDAIYERLSALTLWIGNGGFIPTLPNQDSQLDNWTITNIYHEN